MLLNVPDELGDPNVADVQQGAALGKKAAVADGAGHEVKKKMGFSADDASMGICEMKTVSVLVTERRLFLDHNCTRAPMKKPAQSTLKSLPVLLIARQ